MTFIQKQRAHAFSFVNSTRNSERHAAVAPGVLCAIFGTPCIFSCEERQQPENINEKLTPAMLKKLGIAREGVVFKKEPLS